MEILKFENLSILRMFVKNKNYLTMKKNQIFLFICFVCSISINAQTGTKRYEVKSGKMVMTSEIFGKEQDMTIYFDDYGLLEYSETNGEIMGFSVHNVQIRKDGYFYNIDMTKKTCTKTKIGEENTPQNMNFSNMTQKLIADLHIEKKGTEEYIGKTCDVWAMDHQDMKMKGTFLVWKGISLKTDMEASGMIIRMKTKSIDITSPLPKNIFEIPSDVKIVE